MPEPFVPAPPAASQSPGSRVRPSSSGTRIFITVIAIATAIATLSLGQWQLRRAAQKEALAQQILQKESQETITNSALTAIKSVADVTTTATATIPPLLNRRVALQGHWLPEHTVYLQNRQMNRQPGFYVLTPLRLQATSANTVTPTVADLNQQAVVWVQRGWVPRNFQDFTQLQPVTSPQAMVQISGRLIAQASTAFALGADNAQPTASMATPGAGASRIRHNLNIASFAAQTGLPLLPLVVLQTDANSDGLQRQWPAVESGVEKHYGYAFQWFALSGLIVVLYVWFQIISPRRRRATVEENL